MPDLERRGEAATILSAEMASALKRTERATMGMLLIDCRHDDIPMICGVPISNEPCSRLPICAVPTCVSDNHHFPLLGCCAVLFQERRHLVLVVPFRPDERGTLILSVFGVEIGAMVEQDTHHLQLAMPGSHVQRGQGADDLTVEIFSWNIRIGARA